MQNATKYWITSFGAAINANGNPSRIPDRVLKDILKQIEINSTLIAEKWVNHFGEIDFIS